MELSYQLRLPVPAREAFAFFTDLERVAACMPGAVLSGLEGDTYRGAVKVKVGPIVAEYRGDAKFIDVDAERYRAVLEAKGREIRGQGTARAVVTGTLEPEGDTTLARIEAELIISGRAAQFGRSILDEVGEKLFNEFVARLESQLTPTGDGAGATPGDPPGVAVSAAGQARTDGVGVADAAPIDIVRVLAGPLAKRLLPGALIVGVVVVLYRRRRR